ncbi:MAG: F0F1 ATP synthase subunit epsilon [Proteobacteria bacterium]|nr:F0F1 ATP synthase subunit epsilon [Pseudomonadota bacterium]
MAEERVEFELVTPERLVISRGVDMVVVPGTEGDFGVLPGHTPMVSTVRPGVVNVYQGNEIVERMFVAGGFAEVTAARCTVLADRAVAVDELDRAAAEQTLKDAREDLADAKTDDERREADKQIAICEEILRITGS